MNGLSSFSINSIVLSNAQTDPNDPTKLVGNVAVTASLSSNLSAHVGGGIEAKCGFIHPSVSIGGTATVSGITGSAGGTFFAGVNNNQVCLNSLTITALSVNYSNIDVSIDGLGIFNTFLSPLVDAIVGLFKGQILSAISSAITPILNSVVNGAMPQCQNL